MRRYIYTSPRPNIFVAGLLWICVIGVISVAVVVSAAYLAAAAVFIGVGKLARCAVHRIRNPK